MFFIFNVQFQKKISQERPDRVSGTCCPYSYLNHSFGATDFQNLPTSSGAIRKSQVDNLCISRELKMSRKEGGKHYNAEKPEKYSCQDKTHSKTITKLKPFLQGLHNSCSELPVQKDPGAPTHSKQPRSPLTEEAH